MNRFKIVCIFLIALLSLSASAWAEGADTDIKLEEMVGQMLMVGFRGFTAPPNSKIVRDIQKYNLGGVVLFDYDVVLKKSERNIKSAEQIKNLTAELQSYSKTPLLIAVDQEGGRVARLKEKYGFPPAKSAQELGEMNDLNYTQEAGYQVGMTLKNVGINLDFAPVVDININPDNPVIGKLGRSFSRSPRQVTLQAQAFMRGLNRAGVLSCLKHFPGHGSSFEDSHLGLPDVSQTWRRKELEPYRSLISSRDCNLIMVGHLFNSRLDNQLPSSLSVGTIDRLLRGKLGFKGVVISDDMQMGAITDKYDLEKSVFLAIGAGVDILLFGNNLNYDPDVIPAVHGMIMDMVEDGRLSRKRIETSYERILNLKKKLKRKAA